MQHLVIPPTHISHVQQATMASLVTLRYIPCRPSLAAKSPTAILNWQPAHNTSPGLCLSRAAVVAQQLHA